MEWFIFDDLFGINQIYVEKFFAERLHFAVKDGDIDQVEELLEEPGSTINSCYYGESLLWTAIMNQQEEMATFLIDNGIDTTFKSCRIELVESEEDKPINGNSTKKTQIKVNLSNSQSVQKKTNEEDEESETTATADVFVISCRQLAYEKEMYDVVNLIDFKQGCLLRCLKPPSHIVRLVKSARAPDITSDLVLPPDRAATNSSAKICRRKYRKIKKRPEIPKSTICLSSAKVEVEQQETDASNISQVPPLNIGDNEEAISERKVSVAVLKGRNRRILHTPTDLISSRQLQNSAMIRLTKTALMRQREVSSAVTDAQQYSLRHSENVETPSKPPIIPGQPTEFERRMSKYRHSFTVSPQNVRSATYSSYGNHLPFRRKPVPQYNHFVGSVLKKSLHCYQHSSCHSLNRKLAI